MGVLAMKGRRRRVCKKPDTTRRSVYGFADYLRKNMTKAELHFWKHLKIRQKLWKYKFEAQVVVHGYVADFYCHELKLAVEIDGRIHLRGDVKKRDRIRTQNLLSHGVNVMRFSNSHVFREIQQILSSIHHACKILDS